jgi:hypothetical protein
MTEERGPRTNGSPKRIASQSIPELLVNALKIIIPGVREVIVNPPSSQRNVTEWCKKDDCWTAVMKRTIEVNVGTLPAEEADPLLAPVASAR